MSMTSHDARTLAQKGFASLQSGQMRDARGAFERLVAENWADTSVFLSLAFACRKLNDSQAAFVAVDAALQVEPHNLQALLLKADLLDAEGQLRIAMTFYLAAIKYAPDARSLSEPVRHELLRAQAKCQAYEALFAQQLKERLDRVSAELGASSPRFSQSLELLYGAKQIYHQQPSVYYFPGLPQIQFFERGDFPWLDQVEAATADIRAELMAVLEDHAAFEPYVQDRAVGPKGRQGGLLNSPDWGAFHLWKNGEVVAENAARCPKTMAALANAPLTRLRGRSPSIMFSLLRPGTRIPPHHGLVNTRLICHLPLIVPPDCALRVGNDTREVKAGKAWIFDDTMEHEAWNLSDQPRVILLFEVWRPELSHEERALVSAMFDALDEQQSGPQVWSI
jgi:tetratricopeptide (TPR) repeat protein